MLVDPHRLFINMSEVHKLRNRRQSPGEWIQEVQGRNRMEVCKDRIHPDHTEHTGAEHHEDGRHDRLTEAAAGSDGAVHEGRNTVGESHDTDPVHTGVDDGRFRRKQCEELASEQQQAATEREANGEGIGHTDQEALLHAIDLAGAVVLAHEACAGHIDCGHGIIDQVVCIGRRRVSLYHQRIEGVDTGLDKEVCKGEHGILKSRRHTEHQHTLSDHAVKLHLPEMQCIAVLHLRQRMEDQSRGHTLGNRTRQRDADHAQLTHDDEEQIQHDIQYARDREVGKRLLRITDRAEDRVAVVVQRERRHTEEVDPEVHDRPRQQIRLRVDDLEQCRRPEESDEQQDHASDQADDQRRPDRLFHVLCTTGTVEACDQHIDAAAEADQKARKERHEDTRGTNSSERRRTREATDDRHIRYIKQHLQKVR